MGEKSNRIERERRVRFCPGAFLFIARTYPPPRQAPQLVRNPVAKFPGLSFTQRSINSTGKNRPLSDAGGGEMGLRAPMQKERDFFKGITFDFECIFCSMNNAEFGQLGDAFLSGVLECR